MLNKINYRIPLDPSSQGAKGVYSRKEQQGISSETIKKVLAIAIPTVVVVGGLVAAYYYSKTSPIDKPPVIPQPKITPDQPTVNPEVVIPSVVNPDMSSVLEEIIGTPSQKNEVCNLNEHTPTVVPSKVLNGTAGSIVVPSKVLNGTDVLVLGSIPENPAVGVPFGGTSIRVDTPKPIAVGTPKTKGPAACEVGGICPLSPTESKTTSTFEQFQDKIIDVVIKGGSLLFGGVVMLGVTRARNRR